MRAVQVDGVTVALVHRTGDWKPGLDFLTDQGAFIQAGTWWYAAGKELRAHHHIPNARRIDHTQEVVVVIAGRLRIDLYNTQRQVVHQEILEPGDLGIILAGGHGYGALSEDTRVIEVKNGPFYSVERDKEVY